MNRLGDMRVVTPYGGVVAVGTVSQLEPHGV